MNATADEITQVLEQVPLDMLQFHGDETAEQCQQIALQTKRRWYKAIQVKPELDIIKSYKKLPIRRCKRSIIGCLAS